MPIDNELRSVVDRVTIAGVDLPLMVLRRKYKHYYFFDADVSSSIEMISAIEDSVLAAFGPEGRMGVFASSSRSLLGSFAIAESWSSKVLEVAKANRDLGDAGGLIIADVGRRWVVYQFRPVDIGLLAIDSNLQDRAGESFRDSFFDCMEVKNWLEYRNTRNDELLEEFGEKFLGALVENYSATSV